MSLIPQGNQLLNYPKDIYKVKNAKEIKPILCTNLALCKCYICTSKCTRPCVYVVTTPQLYLLKMFSKGGTYCTINSMFPTLNVSCSVFLPYIQMKEKQDLLALRMSLKRHVIFFPPPQAEMKISTGTLCIYLSILVLMYPCDKTAHGGI